MAFKASPMGSAMFVISILGFFISVIYIPQFSESWATAFAIVFACMFVAGMIDMVKATPGPQLPGGRKH